MRTYSTLGWFKDPVLNTFLGYSDNELAQLIFHELAHQVVYVRDDSTFNESFATAVELEGIAQWLNEHGTEKQRALFVAAQERKAASAVLMLDYRKQLEELYASGQSDDEKRAGKAHYFCRAAGKNVRLGGGEGASQLRPLAGATPQQCTFCLDLDLYPAGACFSFTACPARRQHG